MSAAPGISSQRWSIHCLVFKFPSGVVHRACSLHRASSAQCGEIVVVICMSKLLYGVLAQYLLQAGRCCRSRPT
jgi:hypothetical protein